MNMFNRAVVILGVLLLIVVLIIAAVVPDVVLERILYTTDLAKGFLEARRPTSYLLFLLVDVVLVLVFVAWLWFELKPRPRKAVSVRNVSGAKAEMSTDSVEHSLQNRLIEIGDVLKARPIVRGRRGKVDIHVDLETAPGIDVPAKTAEVAQAARDVVEGKMGLKIGSIKIHVKQAAYGRTKAAPAAASEPTPMLPEPAVTNLEPVPAPTPGEDVKPSVSSSLGSTNAP
jgi:uncharacterized alkaline shock family protein YloU